MDQITNPDTALPRAIPQSGDPLKIAVLSYRSAPHVGGQGIYLDYLTRALVNFGHKVDVISGPPYPELDSRVRVIEMPSLDLYAQKYHGHLSLRPKHLLSATDTYEYFGHLSGKFVEPYTFGQRAFDYLKTHHSEYDVFLDNQTLAEGILRLKTDLKRPLVTIIHHPITRDRRLDTAAEKSFRRRLLIRRWYAFHHMQVRVARRQSHIISPSEIARSHISEEFKIDPNVIKPIRIGIDRADFSHKPEVKKEPMRLVTTASADVALKGLVYLVEAYSKVIKRFPDAKLVVIGTLRDGPTKDKIKQLGLMDKIEFKSRLSREDLANEFRRASLLVSPSLYEGYGLPAAEAMSCGTAVVSTDGGALPEVVGDAGIVVPKGDASALAEAISSLLEDPAKLEAVAAACLKRAEDLFDWANIVPEYDDVLREAITAKC